MNNVIRVEGVSKSFGDVVALADVDLSVQEGTVFGLLGPNGAGKTTMVRVLTTLLKPDSGSAFVAGHDVVLEAAALRSKIGLAGQYAAVDEILTGAENLEMVGRLYRLSAAEARRRAAEILERFGLTHAGDRTVRTYSGGMRRRLDLAASLVGRPAVLFLDEPTTGLDPRSRIGLWEFIETLVDEGTTLLLTTQYLEEADRLADRIGVIDSGRVIAEGTSDDLKTRVGGDVLELKVADSKDLAAAAAAVADLGLEYPQVDEGDSMVLVSVNAGGGSVITQAVRKLDEVGIGLADLSLRRPTLDDVFLTLTGHHAEEETPNGRSEPNGGKRRRRR